MSATSYVPSSFATKLYNETVYNSLSCTFNQNLRNKSTGILASKTDDSCNVTILKLIGAKFAKMSVFCLATIESVARVALGLIVFSFSLLTWLRPPLSNRAELFAADLMGDGLRCATHVIQSSFFSFLFE
jgi:hypothetical protein